MWTTTVTEAVNADKFNSRYDDMVKNYDMGIEASTRKKFGHSFVEFWTDGKVSWRLKQLMKTAENDSDFDKLEKFALRLYKDCPDEYFNYKEMRSLLNDIVTLRNLQYRKGVCKRKSTISDKMLNDIDMNYRELEKNMTQKRQADSTQQLANTMVYTSAMRTMRESHDPSRICADVLRECGLDVVQSDFFTLQEDAKLQVTDELLTGMMRFITDKYNSLDFREIEKSAGDIAKFKYTGLIKTNTDTLLKIYTSSTDSGAGNYVEVCNAIVTVMDHLNANRQRYSSQYQAGNGVVQLLYTSLVAGCLYAVGTLISNTIRFVTTEQDTDCQVLYDEIPGTIKNVHIKNILAAANDIKTFEALLNQYEANARGKRQVQESVSVGLIVGGIVAGVIILLPRIIVLIREIIYSIYYLRVKIADMIQVQVMLLNVNIESLESGRGTTKVIARQKKIVNTLEKWQNRIALKMDTANALVAMQKKKEATALRVDATNPIMQDPGAYSSGDLML